MAFGGVATGSMKAHDAQMVTGSITYRGLIPMSLACKRKPNIFEPPVNGRDQNQPINASN